MSKYCDCKVASILKQYYVFNAKQPKPNQKHDLQGKHKWLSLTVPEDHDCTQLKPHYPDT